MILATVAAVLALAPTQLPPAQLPPLPCLPQPLPPVCLPGLPPTGDDPPRFEGEFALEPVGGGRVVATWPAASDDGGLAGYRLYRDGNYLGSRGPGATRARLRLPCGWHRYRVEAVDTSGQTASLSARVLRRC